MTMPTRRTAIVKGKGPKARNRLVKERDREYLEKKQSVHQERKIVDSREAYE